MLFLLSGALAQVVPRLSLLSIIVVIATKTDKLINCVFWHTLNVKISEGTVCRFFHTKAVPDQ